MHSSFNLEPINIEHTVVNYVTKTTQYLPHTEFTQLFFSLQKDYQY